MSENFLNDTYSDIFTRHGMIELFLGENDNELDVHFLSYDKEENFINEGYPSRVIFINNLSISLTLEDVKTIIDLTTTKAEITGMSSQSVELEIMRILEQRGYKFMMITLERI